MKAQEVVSIFSEVPANSSMKTYPELDEWFDKGMYVEQVVQTQFSTGKYVITFVLRYYNKSLSKEKT